MTLDQLADLLGLSKTTVSRALAGYADVSPKTRQRVEEAAERYGYRPNPLAQRLRSGRAEAAGLVIPTDRGAFADPFFLDLLTSLSQALSERGLDLLVTAAEQGEAELAALERMVAGKRVDGMIVVRTRRRDARIRYLLERRFPFVCHGRTEEHRPYAFVDMDGEAASRLAVDHLVALGHRRIAYVGAPPELAYSNYQKRGYLAGLRAANLPVDPKLMVDGGPGESFGREVARRLLGARHPPSAFVCATDLEAFGVLHTVAEAGLAAGRDVAVIGHDDLPAAQHADPPLTTIHQPRAAVGVRLAEMLEALLAGEAPEDHRELWRPVLVERQSTGPVSA